MKTNKSRIFQNKTYTRLLIANVAAKMGAYIGTTAFLFFLLKEFTEQPLYATINELLSTLPVLLVFFLMGVAADKFDRQRIMYLSQTVSIFLSVCLLVALFYGSIYFMFLFIALRVMVQAFFAPAQSAVMQGILKPEEYMVASGVNQVVVSLMGLFGRGIGIAVFWAVGLMGAIVIDILALLLSAILIATVTISNDVRLPNGTHRVSDLKVKVILKEYGDGIRYIVENKPLRNLLTGYFVFGMLSAAYAILPVYMLKYQLAPETYETIAIWEGIIIGVGLLVGTYVISKLTSRISPKQLISYGLLLTGITTAILSLSTSVPFFLIAIFGSAFFLPAINIGIGGIVPHIVHKEKMGRVAGCITPLTIISQALMLLFIAWAFPAHLDAGVILGLTGGLMVLVSLFYLLVLPKKIGKPVEIPAG